MSAFANASLPKSALGRYRVMAPAGSVRISPLILGAMSLGDKWANIMGTVTKKEAFEILDYFVDQGGNAIDTANGYQDEQSEEWIGEWMELRKNREELIIMTKFTSPFGKAKNKVNFTGNSIKSMRVSLDASLRKLRTPYVDVLYVHWLDYATDVPELAQALNALVLAGKVLYLAISDTPAWYVTKFNQYARDHGMRQFSLYQGRWSAAERDFEREIIPMCRAEGMGIAPWGALGGGSFKTAEQRAAMEKAGEKGRNFGRPTPKHDQITPVLEKISKRLDTTITSVALAYVMRKAPYVFPIVGCRRIQHLKDNIAALELVLSDEDMEEIDGAVPFEAGFPHNFLGGSSTSTVPHLKRVAYYDFVEEPKAIIYKPLKEY